MDMSMADHHDDVFDQYAMERIMLGKWKRSPLLCAESDEWCRTHADIVVVPSLVFHMMLSEGFVWEAKVPESAKDMVGKYWDLLRTTFHRPEENHFPLIVVHSPFAWNRRGYNYQLHALSEQPDSFKGSVIIPSTGSNLEDREAQLFGEAWSPGAHKQLLRRAKLRAEGVRDPAPLLITVPYPTSIAAPVGKTPANKRVLVSMFASPNNVHGGENWIRGLLAEGFAKMTGSTVDGDNSFVCAEGYSDMTKCGLGEDPNMWDMAVSSQFCIEPAGDTLCRSHFYIAMLSGCIPVIIDGGHDLYTVGNEPTWWAWRADSSQEDSENLFVDYRKYAVVYAAEDIKSQNIDIVQDLKNMPVADPERFRALQTNVEAIAPRMRYSKEDCTGSTCLDAFGVLHEILVQEHARSVKL